MSVVGQDEPSFVSLMARIAHMELAVAQFVGVPVPQIREDLVDGVQAAPQELKPNRSGEQFGAVPVPQIKEDDVETTMEQDRVCAAVDPRSARATKHAPIPQMQYSDKATKHVEIPQFHVHIVAGMPVAIQRQTLLLVMYQATKHVEIPADAVHRRGRHYFCCDAATGLTNHVETPHTQYIDKVVAVPTATQRQVSPSLNQVTNHVETSADTVLRPGCWPCLL